MYEQGLLKNDILMLSPQEFYLKHIVKSTNWYFSEYLHISPDVIVDRIDYFKEIVSERLRISFHSLQMVGSAKIGYSLSPPKALNPFNSETSDIDIAIISEKWFQDINTH